MRPFCPARTLAPRRAQHGAMQTRRRAQQGGSDAPLPSQPAREPDPWLTPARVRLKERCERLLQKLKTQFAAPLASGALTLPSLFQLAGPCTAAGGLVDMSTSRRRWIARESWWPHRAVTTLHRLLLGMARSKVGRLARRV